MGMLMDFYTGDTDAVMKMLGARTQGRAVAEDAALVRADFCLNLHTVDLDSLSQELHRIAEREPVGVFDSFDDDLDVGAEQDYGIHVMHGDWVQTVAAFPDAQVDELANQWFRAIAEESGEPLTTPAPEAIVAIKDLVTVCRKAVQGETPVVFYWSL